MDKIADEIGEKYKEWGMGDCIFISSPTGSGKTFFILNVLLPFLRKNNQKILYLVNRRILKQQIEKEIEELQYKMEGISSAIKVTTYQNIERSVCYGEYDEKRSDTYKGFAQNGIYTKYSCVVCDECHYFLADSNYNANTGLSFRLVQELFYDKMRIFMSATIVSIQTYIKRDNWKRYTIEGKPICTPYYGFCPQHEMYVDWVYKEYGDQIEKDYGYLEVGIVSNKSEIVELISNKKNKGKWLVFVDSIDFGEKLKEELKQLGIPDNEITFVTSGYRYDEEGLGEVKHITDREMQSVRILISTAVLDNGINLKDINLRNMVIMADTEAEFIQMLGRKREDGKRLNLYIYKYDKNTFVGRQRQVKKQLKIIFDYLKEFDECIQGDLDKMFKFPQYIPWDKHNETEQRLIKKNHIKVMRDIASNRIKYEDARRAFCVYGGTVYLNLLAYQNLKNLNLYYQEIIERLTQSGGDAFLREQLSWLGFGEEKVTGILLGEVERSRARVIKAFEEQLKTLDLSKDKFIDFKLTIRSDLLVLLQSIDNNTEGWKTAYKAIYSPDRPLTPNAMKFLNKHCKVPYAVKQKQSKYTVERVEENVDIIDKK